VLQTVQQDIDPLLIRIPLPYTKLFFPRGLPAVVFSNSRAVLEAAEISWGGGRQRVDAKPIELRCIVEEGGIPADDAAPRLRAYANMLVSVRDAANFATADLSSGVASIWVSAATVANAEIFRYHFLEAMCYTLLDVLHLVALHAACVQRNGKGVLLAGESGAGKSSLAYACACQGWVYLSDDASSLLRQGEHQTVIGAPERFRFRGSASDLFPEFRGWTATTRGNSKPSIEVPTASLQAIVTAPESRVDFIVLLNRGAHNRGRPSLVPVGNERVLDQLFHPVWPDQLPANEERRRSIERLLTTTEKYELRYDTLSEAIALLNGLTDFEENK
jgi:hypothetical protein